MTRRRTASVTKIRAVHQARQKCRAERAALEAAYDHSSVHTGADYERFVANILTGAGISTVRVGKSGDYGADLLTNTATGTAVIQCKFYSHPVGYDAAKEAYTAKTIVCEVLGCNVGDIMDIVPDDSSCQLLAK